MKNWIIVAADAWKKFQQDGKGYFLFHGLPPKRIQYFAYNDKGLEEIKDSITPLVKEYDPEKEVVIAVMDSRSKTAEFFILRGDIDPPQAWEEAGEYIYKRRTSNNNLLQIILQRLEKLKIWRY